MATIICLKKGRIAIEGDPAAPQIEFQEGSELDVEDSLAKRLIDLGYAEQKEVKSKPKAKATRKLSKSK
jgi:hypothetical protein